MQRISGEELSRNLQKVKFKIAVMSGKGGVGKSTVSALLAVHYAKKGKKVGIFDADFLGPSIPKLFSLEKSRLSVVGDKLEPVLSTKYGIKVVSIQSLLPSPDTPVIWRGPLIAGMIRELLGRTNWDELDYLIIDLPPGTGDAPLTILQDVKPNGILVVTTPQDLAVAIVEKSIKMAEELKSAVLGIVENMSYFICPKCGEKSFVFGKGKAEILYRKYRLDFITQIPIDSELLKLSELGKIENFDTDYFEFFPY
ncbi:MAG: Mrp/NBP35 family ATP-binding protein [Archaeoglobaceae archaeon]|uniref:Iron-sulfur cluster carrier protein n=1 Tax=Archaeoglobus fulgidus TaxID=2234 RepID=A0A7J3M0L7_ARCFL